MNVRLNSVTMKTLTPQKARENIRRYCAYQERCHQEVRDKLYSYGLHRGDVDEILTNLITEGFLNEERFAKAYAGGKFRMKKWGRIKITHALESKGISKNCIRLAMKEIDDEAYMVALHNLLSSKAQTLKEDDPFLIRQRLADYALQKGYESDLVWRQVAEIVPKN